MTEKLNATILRTIIVAAMGWGAPGGKTRRRSLWILSLPIR